MNPGFFKLKVLLHFYISFEVLSTLNISSGSCIIILYYFHLSLEVVM